MAGVGLAATAGVGSLFLANRIIKCVKKFLHKSIFLQIGLLEEIIIIGADSEENINQLKDYIIELIVLYKTKYMFLNADAARFRDKIKVKVKFKTFFSSELYKNKIYKATTTTSAAAGDGAAGRCCPDDKSLNSQIELFLKDNYNKKKYDEKQKKFKDYMYKCFKRENIEYDHPFD